MELSNKREFNAAVKALTKGKWQLSGFEALNVGHKAFLSEEVSEKFEYYEKKNRYLCRPGHFVSLYKNGVVVVKHDTPQGTAQTTEVYL